MSLPGHRRTSSDKRRRAAHFALTNAIIAKDKKTGVLHLPHIAAPGATEYNDHKIHVKGQRNKIEKLLKAKPTTVKKTTTKKTTKKVAAEDSHAGHNH